MNFYNILFTITRWIPGLAIATLGILYFVLVHPIPGIVCLLLSFVFFPPANDLFRRKLGMKIPLPVQVLLFIIIFWFTLGVSDLGDMID